MSIYGDDKHNVHSEYVSPVNKYAVDIPNINHIRLGNVEEWTNVGVFKTKEEAIEARLLAATKYHKEFVRA